MNTKQIQILHKLECPILLGTLHMGQQLLDRVALSD